MCEFLIAGKDSGGIGDGQILKGDVVSVAEDDHEWTDAERIGNVIVKAKGADPTTYSHMARGEWGWGLRDGEEVRICIRKRNYAASAAAVDAALAGDGTVTVNKNQIDATLPEKDPV
jgi:hypothetical protein